VNIFSAAKGSGFHSPHVGTPETTVALQPGPKQPMMVMSFEHESVRNRSHTQLCKKRNRSHTQSHDKNNTTHEAADDGDVVRARVCKKKNKVAHTNTQQE